MSGPNYDPQFLQLYDDDGNIFVQSPQFWTTVGPDDPVSFQYVSVFYTVLASRSLISGLSINLNAGAREYAGPTGWTTVDAGTMYLEYYTNGKAKIVYGGNYLSSTGKNRTVTVSAIPKLWNVRYTTPAFLMRSCCGGFVKQDTPKSFAVVQDPADASTFEFLNNYLFVSGTYNYKDGAPEALYMTVSNTGAAIIPTLVKFSNVNAGGVVKIKSDGTFTCQDRNGTDKNVTSNVGGQLIASSSPASSCILQQLTNVTQPRDLIVYAAPNDANEPYPNPPPAGTPGGAPLGKPPMSFETIAIITGSIAGSLFVVLIVGYVIYTYGYANKRIASKK